MRLYASQLVSGVIEAAQTYDDKIGRVARQYPVHTISAIDRNIIRLAIFEIESNRVPYKVAINAAVEIAKLYGGDSSPKFINGVLGALMHGAPRRGEGKDG
jgi:N utilization substance protein B